MAQYDTPIWVPSKGDLQLSPMAKFKDFASRKSNRKFTGYHELHAWSVNPETAGDFWMALFEFLEMNATVHPSKAFEPVSDLIPSVLVPLLTGGNAALRQNVSQSKILSRG